MSDFSILLADFVYRVQSFSAPLCRASADWEWGAGSFLPVLGGLEAGPAGGGLGDRRPQAAGAARLSEGQEARWVPGRTGA
jgi:hypothetical protein